MDNELITDNVSAPLPEVEKCSYPDTPFENIGFALSGGGFRAAAYGLGVMSLMHYIKLEEDDSGKSTLLDKVSYISSASGGTITLTVYAACIHNGISFNDFYKHMYKQLTGEDVLQSAIGYLRDENAWQNAAKSRNLINAFALAYHEKLFSIIPNEPGRLMGTLMQSKAHIDEVCFNATEFYTGISFRFQAGHEWAPKKGGVFGNNNININYDDKGLSIASLKKIRLADVLAASSCFPMGFEPIVFPKDFTYNGGPTTEELKKALLLKTYSWDDTKPASDNQRSERATAEKEFSKAGQFGLMDGGICDNQGLYSTLQANKRNPFDLIMVSDVTSFYMTPYNVPAINTSNAWLQNTPEELWDSIRKKWSKIRSYISIAWIVIAVICLAAVFAFYQEGIQFSTISLGVLALILLLGLVFAHKEFNQIAGKKTKAYQALQCASIPGLVKHFFPKDSFADRIALKVSAYMQNVKLGMIVQMANARLNSVMTMVGDVFLKHIRRLIYEDLFNDENLEYRRLDNMIYKLSYTNDKNRRNPRFDSQGEEDIASYDQRKEAFLKEVAEKCILTDDMKKIAEMAYNTGTTLWFEQEQEKGTLQENNRVALIATGHFTSCYNLLEYSLSLKHSRYFDGLQQKYKDRIQGIIKQLSDLMIQFGKDPLYLYKEYGKDSK
jgi:hypothetical protein